MGIEKIKVQILNIYQKCNNLFHSKDDDTYDEIYESDVRSLIIKYSESKGYEVEGYPFQKRFLGETDQYYDEDYFCYERNLKYLAILAATKEDVLELMYFNSKTFWPDQVGSKEEYKKYLIEGNENNSYDIEF
jgi:hypothetical protein